MAFTMISKITKVRIVIYHEETVISVHVQLNYCVARFGPSGIHATHRSLPGNHNVSLFAMYPLVHIVFMPGGLSIIIISNAWV